MAKEEIKEDKVAEETPEKESKEKPTEEKKEESTSKKKKDKSYEAILNIYTSFNNTLVHVTDMSGKTISKITGGMVTKHDRLKANPTIGMFIAKRIEENVKDLGVKNFYVRIRAKTGNPAPGPGANAIIKSLSRAGFKILNILDTTRIPRGGPKKKGGRRGRRP
jgi:small subunit ribosomal protein S11|tara:strand:+ start:32557 stop:33048 length:492 start_codon:yes stop_codon:yes gene_type:complete